MPPPATITLGIVDYSSHSDETILEKELKGIGNTAQGNLSFYESCFKYKFQGQVISGKYSNILRELKDGKIDIAFVPPYCYLYHNYLSPNELEEVELVGIKTKWSNLTYTSGFLVRQDSDIKSLDDINKNTVKVFIHGDYLSTSTYIIPSIFLWEHGLTKIVPVHEPRRREMIPKILNARVEEGVIGTLSNEDWERIRAYPKGLVNSMPPWLLKTFQISARDQYADFLRFIPIDNIPIPYDAVLVHTPSWTKRFKVKEREIILNALRNTLKQVKGRWEEQYPAFVDYVASGVIAGKFLVERKHTDWKKGESYLVFLPKVGLDLYHLNDLITEKNSIKVDIFRFRGEQGPKYSLEKIKIGSGELMKMNDTDYPNAVLLFNLNTENDIDNLIGLHILAGN